MAEHSLGKGEVAGPIPAMGTTLWLIDMQPLNPCDFCCRGFYVLQKQKNRPEVSQGAVSVLPSTYPRAGACLRGRLAQSNHQCVEVNGAGQLYEHITAIDGAVGAGVGIDVGVAAQLEHNVVLVSA